VRVERVPRWRPAMPVWPSLSVRGRKWCRSDSPKTIVCETTRRVPPACEPQRYLAGREDGAVAGREF